MTFFAIAAKCRAHFAQFVTNYYIILFMRVSLLLFITAIVSTNLLIASSVKGQAVENVQVKIELKGESLTDAFKKIEAQTSFTFLYRNEDVAKIQSINLSDENIVLSTLLEKLLAGSSLTFKQVDQRIVINKKTSTQTTTKTNDKNLYSNLLQDSIFVLTGKVLEGNTGLPVPGATVLSKIARTNADSRGVFKIPVKLGERVKITYIGYEPLEVTVKNGEMLTVSLTESVQSMKEVVVTGLFTRKAESFTGTVSTFSQQELKRVGNINILQSLAILDPSFRIADNTSFGSNPNRLPEVTLRGAAGIPDLNSTYQNAPNLPLFILDGFETTVQKVYDLNMNMVASVTLLKDASAKAIYGSKAGNGVVVIETVKPAPGNIRVSYTGSLDITAPDLTSYNMTNSLQKVQAEVLGDKYVSAYPENQYPLTQQYAANQQLALSGVDTYWLAAPLQNGIGQKHNIYADGGTDAMSYSAGINYNDLKGVMKGSDRRTLTGLVNLQYRTRKFSFRNNLSIDQNKATNSPYGSFSAFSLMNPYWKMYGDDGKLIFSYPVGGTVVINPLYDATLNSKDYAKYTNITENFYAEWEAKKNLRFTARVGLASQANNSVYFVPATHSRYSNISVSSPEYLNRGEYTIGNGRASGVSSDLSAAYSFIAGKHQVFSNLIYSIQETANSSNGVTMVGFPNDRLDDISFGRQYPTGSKPTGIENTTRSTGVTSSTNYSYDNRYIADVSIRANASSQFGADNRWGTFWSTGLGWNIHNESFMNRLTFVNQLKLRGNIGSSGTQNFSAYQSLTTYRYANDQVYSGEMGLKLIAMANPNLKWQQILDKNIGLDAGFFNRLTLGFNFYQKDTQDLLSDQTLAPSSGFNTYKENVGKTRNQGVELNLNTRIYSDPTKRTYINVFASMAHNKNKLIKLSDALSALNAIQDAKFNGVYNGINGPVNTKPLTRFAENQSLSAIWAVPSLGIDPSNGKEIFVKRDGTLTQLWSAADQVVVGDASPKYSGSFGSNMQYRGFTLNFALSYRVGGQMYNQALVDKVENADINANVDVRFLEGRWKTPGQVALFKDIKERIPTKATSRFVQDDNEIIFSSINMGYDFSKLKFVKALNMNSLSIQANANELGRIGSVKTERGTDYPFARTISFSLQATF